MRFLLSLALVATASWCLAQDPADIFHKTVDLDAVNEVSFDVHANDQLEVKTWPGDDILIETSVKLNNGKPHVLKFFLEKQRWDLDESVSGEKMVLVSRDKVRKQVKGTEVSTSETVVIVVYMPEDFAAAGERTYRRQSR